MELNENKFQTGGMKATNQAWQTTNVSQNTEADQSIKMQTKPGHPYPRFLNKAHVNLEN